MEIKVTERVPLETAMKKLKRKLIKEGLFKELKTRRFYEKPSQKKKRKSEEALKRKKKNKGNRNKRRNYRRG